MLLEHRRFQLMWRSCRAARRCASSAERLESSLHTAPEQQAVAAGVRLFRMGFMEMSRCCTRPINIRHFQFYCMFEYICRIHSARPLWPDSGLSTDVKNKVTWLFPLPPSLSLRSRGWAKLSPNTALMKQTYLLPETPLLIISLLIISPGWADLLHCGQTVLNRCQMTHMHARTHAQIIFFPVLPLN